MDKVLHMIGIAKRAGQVAVGEEPVGAVARARDARLILVAENAADNTLRRAQHFADAGQCILLTVPYSKDELGSVTGVTAAAMMAVTEIGLAGAIVDRLAENDPDRYSAAAERMQVKAQRILQRRREQLQHEKNLRQGKKKKKSADAPAQAPQPEEKAEVQSRPVKKAPMAKKAPAAKKPYRSRERKKTEAPVSRWANSRPVTKGKGSFRKKETKA